MKTIEITPEEMQSRISRYGALKPLPIQQDPDIPQEANDVIYARKLLSVIGLGGDVETPINTGAPIVDAAGMTMTLAVCPPGPGACAPRPPPDLRDLHRAQGPLRGDVERRRQRPGGA